jgi:hypothetical protein
MANFKFRSNRIEPMFETPVMNSFLRFYFGISWFIGAIYIFAINYKNFYVDSFGVFLLVVILTVPSCLVYFGLRGLRQNGVRIDGKILKNLKLIPMWAGFILIALGISVSALSHPTIYPDGTPTGFFYHPFAGQGFVLLGAGFGIQFLWIVWYYDSVSSNIVEKAKSASLSVK